MGSSVVRPGDWVAPHLSGRATADLRHGTESEVVPVGVPGTQGVLSGTGDWDVCTNVPENECFKCHSLQFRFL